MKSIQSSKPMQKLCYLNLISLSKPKCAGAHGSFVLRLKRTLCPVIRAAIVSICLLCEVGTVSAQINWTNTNGGIFSTGSNWAGGVAPNSTQEASFNLVGANLGVTFTAPAATRNLFIGNGAYSFNLGGHTYSLFDTSLPASLVMGRAAGETGSLTLFNGTLTPDSASVGNSSGSSSTLILGAGSRLNASGTSDIGSNGTGLIHVRNGAVFDSDFLRIGFNETGNGQLHVDGANAVANIDGARFGFRGQSLVLVENGGTLNTSGLSTASNVGSFSQISILAGSTWNLRNGALNSGSGTSQIDIRGNLNANNADIVVSESTQMDVVSAGRFNLTGFSTLGLDVRGLFRVIGGGSVDIASDAGLTVRNSGGLVVASGNVATTSLNLDGSLAFSGGQIAVHGGTFRRNGSFALSGGFSSDSIFALADGAASSGLTSLTIGDFNSSFLREFRVLSGSTLNTSALSTIGQLGSGSVVRISGSGSTWNANNSISVGDAGAGTLLIENGGRLNTNGNSLLTGVAGVGGSGTLNVLSGGRLDAGSIELARIAGSASNASFAGSGTIVNAANLFVGGSSSGEGGTASLTIDDGAEVNIAGTLRARNLGTINLNGGRVTTQNFTRSSTGTLNFRDGELHVVGSFSNGSGNVSLIGTDVNENPTLVLSGAASTSGITNLNVGSSNRQGKLRVLTNAQLTTGVLTVGNLGTVDLDGGRLLIGSLASSGNFNWTRGAVDFTSSSSLNDSTLTSLLGSGHSLSENRTLGSTSGTMTLGSFLNVNGGTLRPAELVNNSTLSVNQGQVNTTTLTNNFGRMMLVSGNSSVSANTGVNNFGTIRMNSPTATISGGILSNELGGLISGTGQVDNRLINFGTVRVSGSEHLVFTGADNLNVTNANLSGGTLEFTQSLTNRSGAAIMGRGTLITSSSSPGGIGLTNDGLLSFSAGFSDIFGDVEQLSDGRIVTSGGGVTTFFDDVTHNGIEIRTFGGSRTVFLGEQGGVGNFTGTGMVEYAGDLRPGNSPASISYEGDVFFNSSVRTFIELGGLDSDQFDQLLVDGDFHVDGSLFVSLINGHTLGANDFYLIGDVGGTLSGQFNGLAEGSLVGNFGGRDLFITYAGGNGNDIGLFTAVPEPGTGLLLCFVASCFLLVRRRRLLEIA
ncbi:MAG: PEP-CTERM sorting domain-containing protein [Pirellulaceae bacterium]|nr:PEP-CTERM sorting domain-containing protein [Pirellulaceae bacterium]